MTNATRNKLLTLRQARQQLDARGESVADFARRHGIKPAAVYHVLYGIKKGRRGEAHRAAVALGVKAGIEVDTTRGTL